ncbi:MAG: RNA methyltransferase [Anaerolineales bacterium]|nr:RNA methyltransferase [Anaerolineales bacterium]
MPDPLTLEGWVSVLAALEAGRRPVAAVYLQAGKEVRQAGRIAAAARARGLQPQMLPAAELDALAQGRSHGGVLAQAGERTFQTLDELTAAAPDGFFAMLYGVEDPYNYGQAIRALYAAGAHGLVVPERNWDTALNVVARASAGASEYMPTARAAPEAAIQHFKAQGFRAAGTAKARGATPLYAADLRGPLLLLIGGEKRGLGAAAQALCDLQLTIPYGREFRGELDVTSSVAALAFEVMRQRMAG